MPLSKTFTLFGSIFIASVSVYAIKTKRQRSKGRTQCFLCFNLPVHPRQVNCSLLQFPLLLLYKAMGAGVQCQPVAVLQPYNNRDTKYSTVS